MKKGNKPGNFNPNLLVLIGAGIAVVVALILGFRSGLKSKQDKNAVSQSKPDEQTR